MHTANMSRFLRFAAALACGAVAAVPVAGADDGGGDMVLIPAGDFFMGSDKTDTTGEGKEFGTAKPLYLDEHPRHKVHTAAYYMDRYEVTNAKYKAFVIQANYQVPAQWEKNGYLLSRDVLNVADVDKLRDLAANTFRLDMDTTAMSKEALLDAIAHDQHALDDLPVTTVNWYNASDYCHWAGKRLPTEAEWEKAAAGPDGLTFPWGNTWNAADVNAGDDPRWEHGVAPVGSYPGGKSPYGVYDMAGNVMEWVADWYQPYPGNDYHSDDYGQKNKVLRGGGWGGIGHYAIHHFYRTKYRFYISPTAAFNDVGFRCARDATPPAGEPARSN
jgi:formylglycine-generating enzyme required for sulfatase activity